MRFSVVVLIIASIFGSSRLSAQNSPALDWQYQYAADLSQSGTDVCVMNDGNLAVAGWTLVDRGTYQDHDGLILILSPGGQLIQAHTYGRTAENEDEQFFGIAPKNDGGLVAAGIQKWQLPNNGPWQYDYYAVATDSSGNQTATNHFDYGHANDQCWRVAALTNGNFILAGHGYGQANDQHPYVIVVGPSVNFAGSFSFDLYAGSLHAVCATSDGGFIAVGQGQVAGSWDALDLKCDANAYFQNYWTFGQSDHLEIGYAVIEQTDGYLMAAQRDGLLWLIKIDLAGNQQWEYSSLEMTPTAMVAAPDGGFTIAGMNNSGYLLMRFNADHTLRWSQNYGPIAATGCSSLTRLADGSYILVGTLDDNVLVLKTRPEELSASNSRLTVERNFSLQPGFPNPFNSSTEIRFNLPGATVVSLKIYDILGQEVKVLEQGFLSGGSYSRIWDGTDRRGLINPTGVYLIRLQTPQTTFVQKAVLLK